MQTFGFLFLVVSVSSALSYKDTVFQVERLGKEGFEDVIVVKNVTGQTVAIVDVFADDEYQLVKPVGEDVCLVSRFNIKEHETAACFARVPFPETEENKLDLTECEGREVVFLYPRDCTNAGSNGEADLDRQKRACYKKQELQNVCVKNHTYCRRYGWWTGRSRCKSWTTVCDKYEARVVETTECP